MMGGQDLMESHTSKVSVSFMTEKGGSLLLCIILITRYGKECKEM
jgi:hypothetical protein